MATNSDKWFVGQKPVSKGFVGETQVYPATTPPVWSKTFTSATYPENLRAGKIVMSGTYIYVYYTDFRDIPIKTGMDANLVNLNDGTYTDLFRHYGSKTSGSYWETMRFELSYGNYRNNGTDTWRFDLYDPFTFVQPDPTNGRFTE